MTETTTTSTGTAKKPPYIAYSVRDRGEGKDSHWTEIGVAFPHKDGKGFDILFEVVPLNGRITLRTNDGKKK
jgi:hypothetical protein